MSSPHSASDKRADRVRASVEADAWAAVGRGWRPLFGRFSDLGVSFEWHEFELHKPLDWARSFHAGSLELCLNLSGSAAVTCDGQAIEFQPLTSGFYWAGLRNELEAVRRPGEAHRFLTIELSQPYLVRHLQGFTSSLHPAVRAAVRSKESGACMGPVEPLKPAHVEMINSLRTPPVAAEAQLLWFQAKAAELMAQLLFQPDDQEFFCTRQHRLSRERSSRVKAILARDLTAPPTLDAIGKEVGCSPYHLSRTFSSEAGLTIPQYLRKLRMERAAELLRSGECNVTEAAMEVGYSSLSHFSSAFQETFGCCPGLYPIRGFARDDQRS